jgi:diacylglycerol kinase
MSPPFQRPPFTWRRKFTYAFRGLARAWRGERSSYAHFAIATLVVVAAAALGCTSGEWCVLALATGGVLTAELFNSAIEYLGRAITDEERPEIRDALDIAAGAVLLASMTSVVIGLMVLGPRVWALFGDFWN